MSSRLALLALGMTVLVALASADPVPVGSDTTLVLGGPDRWDGRFETAAGEPDWHGWTHADLHDLENPIHWQVSDHLPLAGQFSMWCGTWYENDCADGYGNDWNEALMYERAAADPAVATAVRLEATVRVDSEPGYDYLRVQVLRQTNWHDLIAPLDGVEDRQLELDFTVEPEDYFLGLWKLRFLATSDGGWSDEDCIWDTHGLARVDEVTVTVDGEVASHDDFETGPSSHWLPAPAAVVGDFTQLWHGLDDIDPDPGQQNDSWQVAFIDDGLVVPGTGGSPCVNWCYGPDGWVFNVDAGLQGHGVGSLPNPPIGWYNAGVWNAVISPPLAWPATADAGEIAFDVYAHMQIEICGATAYGWAVRSTEAADPAQLEATAWQPTVWSYYNPDSMPGGPGYHRIAMRLDELLDPDARWVQVRLEAFEGGPWCWGPYVTEGTPAPYFDNVAVRAWSTPTASPSVPPALALRASPNPFNPRVTLRWSQPAAGAVELAIFDARGRVVRRLLAEDRPAGAGRVAWDGRDQQGRAVAAGVYLARLSTTAGTERVKLALVR